MHTQTVGREKCARKTCKNTFTPHLWGCINAQRGGWFFHRSGKVWCPEHIPDYVKAWRRE